MEDQVYVNVETLCRILHEGLGKNLPTQVQKQHRVTACEEFTQAYQTNLHFLVCIGMGYMWWVLQYDLETLCQRKVWRTKLWLMPRKFCLQRSRIKMHTFFKLRDL